MRACFCFEVCGATQPPARTSPSCMHRSQAVATAVQRHLARGALWFCAALHAMLCAARGGRIQRRWSALPAIATESTRARCTRRYRGVLHAACWAARPLLQRTSDRHEARARAAAERGRALRGARCLWASATVERNGEPAAMAVREGASGRLALGSSHQVPVNAGPGRGARRCQQSAKAPRPARP